MNTYLKNYWGIYREFVEHFKNLTYKGIPIPLLTNFYQQIDQELKTKMEKDDFPISGRYPDLKKEMLQPYFDKWIPDSILPSKTIKTDGRILINYDYTRIPDRSYQQWFDQGKTLILSRSKKTHLHGIPTERLDKYEESTEEISNDLVKKAKSLFGKLEHHPAFNNDFFQQTFLKRIPSIIKTLNAAFNLFEKLTISAIIVGTTEDMVSRSLAIVGSMHGIKSICLQHGILMGEEAFMPVFTRSVAVYGEYEKNWYIQRGVTIERIAEIGHPKYDEIFHKTPINHQEFLRKFNLDSTKTPLLVITGPSIDDAKFTKLLTNLIGNPQFQFIIKPHPWEIAKGKYELYQTFEKKYQSVKVLTSKENCLYELLPHVDGIISTLSTVVLESILFNKPVFVYDFLNSNRPYDYFDSLGEHIQKDPDQLYSVINNYYTSPQHKEAYLEIRNQYIKGLYIDGFSASRLISKINEK
jgi:hypothetical protein